MSEDKCENFKPKEEEEEKDVCDVCGKFLWFGLRVSGKTYCFSCAEKGMQKLETD